MKKCYRNLSSECIGEDCMAWIELTKPESVQVVKTKNGWSTIEYETRQVLSGEGYCGQLKNKQGDIKCT